MQQVALWISRRAHLSQKIRDLRYKFMNDLQIFQHCGMSSSNFWSIGKGKFGLIMFACLHVSTTWYSQILGHAVPWVRGFVKCSLTVPQLNCSFPAAQTSKGKSQKVVNKTSYTRNGPTYRDEINSLQIQLSRT